MKKALIILMCLTSIIVASTSLKAQEVTIVLNPGWTWISYPTTDTVDFATAFGDFTPMQGDIIKSQWGSVSYLNGRWRGNIPQFFYPGYGYMYKSNRTVPITVIFNAQQPDPQGDDHEYVDLGLPSGTLWATCNLGANAPEDGGDYFAWGETQPKDDFSWSNYQYCMGSFNTLTKYCNNPDIGYNGFTDNLTTLEPSDDAATANWGDDWRMPTEGEWQELYENTTVTWTTRNGVRGRLFTASNGNSIFMPAAGYCNESAPEAAGIIGDYWTSSLDPDYPSGALSFFFNSSNYYIGFCNRLYGRNVRAVRSGSQSNIPTGAINGKFTINANGDQVYFSQGNLQYQASTNTWRFAENQWNYVGADNCNISSEYEGWIDLFGWGTSGYHNVYDNFNVNYQPYSYSTTMIQTECNYFGYGPSTNMYDPNLTGMSAEYDWGVHNAISNGGNQVGLWRILTREEWNYIINTRSASTINGTTNARFAKATVNGVEGIILFPDDFSVPIYLPTPLQINSGGASFEVNIYSGEGWNALENLGCVFLPSAGRRQVVQLDSGFGHYWSSSFFNSSEAYCVYFHNVYGNYGNGAYVHGQVILTHPSRCFGMSVRLVSDAE